MTRREMIPAIIIAGMDKFLMRRNSGSGKSGKMPGQGLDSSSGASSPLILEDLNVFYLRQLATSLKVTLFRSLLVLEQLLYIPSVGLRQGV